MTFTSTENLLKNVTTFFIKQLKNFHVKKVTYNFHVISDKSNCLQNLDNDKQISQSFPYTVNSPMATVIVWHSIFLLCVTLCSILNT